MRQMDKRRPQWRRRPSSSPRTRKDGQEDVQPLEQMGLRKRWREKGQFSTGVAAELRKLAQPTVTEEHIIARARLPLRVNVHKRHGLLPQDNVHTCENCRNQNLSRRSYGFCPLLHTLANQTFPTVPFLHPILREPAQPHPGYAASACHVAEEDGPVSGACAA